MLVLTLLAIRANYIDSFSNSPAELNFLGELTGNGGFKIHKVVHHLKYEISHDDV